MLRKGVPNMESTIPGYKYLVQNFEDPSKTQVISFIQKEVQEDGSLKLVEDGTTNEAVLNVLIDRVTFLNEKLSSEWNLRVLAHLKEALVILNDRSADRKKRGVEGTSTK